jgi:hypothetical protein
MATALSSLCRTLHCAGLFSPFHSMERSDAANAKECGPSEIEDHHRRAFRHRNLDLREYSPSQTDNRLISLAC